MDRRSFLTALAATPFFASLIPQVALASPAAATALDLGGKPLSYGFLVDVSRSKGALVMSKAMRNLLAASARLDASPMQLVTWNKDDLGNRVMALGDVPIQVTDYDADCTQVIAFVDDKTEILILSPEAVELTKVWEEAYYARVDAARAAGKSPSEAGVFDGEFDARGAPNKAGIAVLKQRPDVIVLTNVPKKHLVA